MRSSEQKIKISIVGLVTLGLGGLVLAHAPLMNGPYYWKWPWRRIDGWRYFPAMFLAAFPLFAAVFVHGAGRARTIAAIFLLMLSMFTMEVVQIGLTVQPFSLTRIAYFIESPMSTSYYDDAYRSIDASVPELLQKYPLYMPQFYLHSQEKPPGPILFFRAIIQSRGIGDQTATIAGLIIGLLATLTIPATYALIRTLLADKNAAFAGCTLIALSPGQILMFPVLDQLYPAITCLLLIAWVMALRTSKPIWAVAFGLFLAAACFIVYHFLVLGVFLSIATLAHIFVAPRQRKPRFPAPSPGNPGEGGGEGSCDGYSHGEPRQSREPSPCPLPDYRARVRSPRDLSHAMALHLKPTLRAIAIATVTIVFIYLILYGYVGFNAVAVFKTALVEQRKHLASLVRPYPRTILFDLTDFVMGAGWIPVALGIMSLMDRTVDRHRRAWGALCWLQIIILAIIGLMQGETARIWLFLLPLLIVPAAMELSLWPRKLRVGVYLAMWLLLCLVGKNMAFMY